METTTVSNCTIRTQYLSMTVSVIAHSFLVGIESGASQLISQEDVTNRTNSHSFRVGDLEGGSGRSPLVACSQACRVQNVKILGCNQGPGLYRMARKIPFVDFSVRRNPFIFNIFDSLLAWHSYCIDMSVFQYCLESKLWIDRTSTDRRSPARCSQ